MDFEIDVRHVLPAVRVPTLILHRTGDHAVPVQHGRHLSQRIAGSKFVELPGDDHDPVTSVQANEIATEIEEFLTGARSDPDPDRVLVTVLFTDIVGSTKLAAGLGDRRWRELLERHHVVVRRELARFRGREIDTAGDGFLAAFDGPARAIRCAVAIRRAVSALGLELRLGAHSGECEKLADRLAGIAVHIAARVASSARPNEIRVSSTVRDLVAGAGIQFADCGRHKLKGIPERWHLYTVVGSS